MRFALHLQYAPDPDKEEHWTERALCRETDPDAFFHQKGGSSREAKLVCLNCPVADSCLMYALSIDERFGIWGVLSEREPESAQSRGLTAPVVIAKMPADSG